MPDFNQSLPLPSSPKDDPKPEPADDKVTDPAIELIREKVSRLYADEPSAAEEEQEIKQSGVHSKHQAYMKDLMASGKGLADIQTAWHSYYQSLPDDQKHEVWNEFYSNQSKTSKFAAQMQQAANKKSKKTSKQTKTKSKKIIAPITIGKLFSTQKAQESEKTRPHADTAEQVAALGAPVLGTIKPKDETTPSLADTKNELVNKITARGKLKPKHHLQSLMFGLGMGLIVVLIFMFGFFNERFIAPFITPSRTASSTPIIIDPNAKVGDESLVIIPKINVEVPVVYDTPSISEQDIQNSLEDGVVHYPTTPKPGEDGNVVIVGHSSNNLLNGGKYKFAFVLLNRLQEGDTITMQYGGKRYVYRVYEKLIVKPNEVGVLGPTDKKASLSLITCDPPGTSINRLVVRAEQISPDSNSNVASTASNTQATAPPEVVPGNAPSLFDRLFSWL